LLLLLLNTGLGLLYSVNPPLAAPTLLFLSVWSLAALAGVCVTLAAGGVADWLPFALGIASGVSLRETFVLVAWGLGLPAGTATSAGGTRGLWS
jgi:hypothetical protein